MKRRDVVLVLVLAASAVGLVLWLTHPSLASEVAKHGGAVWVESETPEGTVVSVIFIARPIGDAELTCLRGQEGYQRLFIDSTRVSGESLKNLAGASELRVLSMGGCPITDEGLNHLPALPDLEMLNLEKTRITDAGLAHLQGLTGLRQLFLYGTDISDTGLEHLRGLTGLVELDVTRTHVTRAGIRRLQEAIPGLTKVRF